MHMHNYHDMFDLPAIFEEAKRLVMNNRASQRQD
jgi:hypothetical protein